MTRSSTHTTLFRVELDPWVIAVRALYKDTYFTSRAHMQRFINLGEQNGYTSKHYANAMRHAYRLVRQCLYQKMT